MSQPPAGPRGITPQAQQLPPQYDYSSVPINELEATRIKLLSLTRSLHKLQHEIAQGATLPRWESLHSQYNVVITQLSAISAEIFQNYDTLASRNVYPLNNFPVTQQEGLLTTLLRKKPSPEVTAWIENAEEFITKLGVDVTKHNDDDEDKEDFIESCLEIMEKEKENHNFFSVFTQQEIDNGLNQQPHPYKINNKVDEDVPTMGMDVNQALNFIYTGKL
ncbi:Med8 protein [Saccharomycopsis crataegensis]|uniref:Mediator of RNA polymerase II transcription subunit 8 n=1 Tax=Saccharomycopsis crataegensis TaxID=43959 RepID=A0AAV5QQR4_9ASCO|nr:Med8 protein [Saccharomycopsis crataegensis]